VPPGAVYGAIDLRLTPEGQYVFLEINPAGQFLYVEYSTGQPIAAALAKALLERPIARPAESFAPSSIRKRKPKQTSTAAGA